MAYSYTTIANNGRKPVGTLAPDDNSPVVIDKIIQNGKIFRKQRDRTEYQRVFSDGSGSRLAGAAERRHQRHRKEGRPGLVRGRQDRHDRELRRRLVCRFQRRVHAWRSGSGTPTTSSRC